MMQKKRIEKQKNPYIALLKFLACLMITNSHQFYKNPLFKLGGGWGNTLFFVVSGYLIGNITLAILPWLFKRYKRLIPLIVIMEVIWLLFFPMKDELPMFIISAFWFTTALMIYYPFYYMAVKGDHIVPVYVLYVVGYVVYYMMMDRTEFFVELTDLSWFKVYFYFGILLIGGCIRKNESRILSCSIWIWFLVALGGLAIWTVEYTFIKVFDTAYQMQFLIHVGMTLFAIGGLAFFLKLNEMYPRKKELFSLIRWISDSTLEIYLLQTPLALVLEKNKYPYNIVIFWIISIAGGIVIHYIYEEATGFIGKRKRV